MSDLAEARRLALSLPEVTEQPHFDMASFRVRGKIFVTVPPEGTRLHVFIDPLEVEGYVAQDPGCDVRVTPPPAFSSMWRKRLARRSCQVRSFRPWAPRFNPPGHDLAGHGGRRLSQRRPRPAPSQER